MSSFSAVDWLKPEARFEVLRARMNEFFNLFNASVARAADEIATGSEDPEVRRQALLWKSQSIAQCKEAAFRLDPLTALFDSWSLCAQMKEYLTDGAGRDLFGSQQGIAVRETELLEEEVLRVAATVLRNEDLSPLSDMVDTVVEKHPIQGALYTRASGVSDYADFATRSSSLSDVAASINQKVTDIARQLTINLAQLPEQIRWQVELVLANDLDEIAEAVNRISIVVADLQSIIREERTATMGVMREEREIVLAEVDRQRQETLEVLSQERVAATEALSSGRDAILSTIQQERIEVLNQISRERIAAVDSVREELAEVVDESFVRAAGLIDHFYVRLLEVLGLACLVGGVIGFAVLRRGRSPSPSSA